METFLCCFDHAKVTAEQGRKEAIGLKEPHGNPQGNPDNRTEGSRPKKSFPKTTTKAPPVTQEVEGVSNLDKDEEELDNKDIEDDDGLKDGFAARDKVENDDTRRPTDNVAVRAHVALAWEPRGHPPPNFVRPNQPYIRDNKPYRNPGLCRTTLKIQALPEAFSARGGEAQGRPKPPHKPRRRPRRCCLQDKCLTSHQDVPEALPIFDQARQRTVGGPQAEDGGAPWHGE